jgi:hypothetical protein
MSYDGPGDNDEGKNKKKNKAQNPQPKTEKNKNKNQPQLIQVFRTSLDSTVIQGAKEHGAGFAENSHQVEKTRQKFGSRTNSLALICGSLSSHSHYTLMSCRTGYNEV